MGIAEVVRGLSSDDALINGEAIVFRADGRSDFNALLTKRGGAEAAVVPSTFLRLDGDDLRQRSLDQRREELMRIVAGVDGVLFGEAIAAEGALFS